MKFAKLALALTQVALITPTAHRALQDTFSAVVKGNIKTSYEDGQDEDEMEDEVELEADTESYQSVAVIPIKGTLMRNPSKMAMSCADIFSLSNLQVAIKEAEADSNIKSIVFRISSPGGSAAGVPEVAKLIQSCTKPTYAVVEEQACSGAYWIANACGMILAEPSAIIGSVGAYIAWLDDSSYLKNNGFSWTVFRNGTSKAAGLGNELSDTDKENYQRIVDVAGDTFRGYIKSRRVVDDAFLQGGIYAAGDAFDANMIDGIVDDVDEFLKTLESGAEI